MKSFDSIVSNKTSKWRERSAHRKVNRVWLRKSAHIALRILSTLRERGITQASLAEKIGVSPQYINKVVKGKENLSLETICKLEEALNIVLIEVENNPKYITNYILNNLYQNHFWLPSGIRKVWDYKTILNYSFFSEAKEETFENEQCSYFEVS